MIELADIQESLYESKQLLQKLEIAASKGPDGVLSYRRYSNGTAVPYLIKGSRSRRVRKRLDPEDKKTIAILRDKTLACKAIPSLKRNIEALELAKTFRDLNLYTISNTGVSGKRRSVPGAAQWKDP